LKVGPTGLGRNPENVLGLVFVRILRIGTGVVALSSEEFGAVFLEGVGDVFQENQPEDDVLVFRCIHVVSQLVSSEPELGLEADVGSGVFRRGFLFCSHVRKLSEAIGRESVHVSSLPG